MEKIITEKMLSDYRIHLMEEEKSSATIEKYMRDLKKLVNFMGKEEVTKLRMIAFKEKLLHTDGYKISSVNSYLVAANRFLEYQGWYDLRVKNYRVQREIFCPKDKHLSEKEYKRLVRTANRLGKRRISMILQTICSTGMRVSELSYLSVAAVRQGCLEVRCKGKIRMILLSEKLQRELLSYIEEKEIEEGTVFRTRSGKPVDRSNIWREMKKLCEQAEIEKSKAYPHNLRHLFAECFYALQNDIAKLADVLGHSSIETTRIYIKTTSEEHRKRLEMMNLMCI